MLGKSWAAVHALTGYKATVMFIDPLYVTSATRCCCCCTLEVAVAERWDVLSKAALLGA